MTEQPKWKLVLENSRYKVFEDETGVYPPEMELTVKGKLPHFGSGHNTNPIKKWKYRFMLEPCFRNSLGIGDNPYHRHLTAWFGDQEKLERIAECVNMDVEHLIRLLCSEKTKNRAKGYYRLVKYFGPFEFDQYPLEAE